MRNIQIILNAILSKNIFEYILVDRELNVISASDGVKKYLDSTPKEGDNILDYLPELVGNEEEIKKIFVEKYCLFSLESVHKNEYYVNISIEYCDQNTAIVLIHNITAITLSKQNLLQYSNESTLLYNTLQKVVDNQNALLFVTDAEKIEFANKKFIDYFHAKDIEDIRRKNLKLYEKFDNTLKNYDELFDRVDGNEEHIKIGNDTFILQATLVETRYKLFTLTKITNLSKIMQLDPLTNVYRKGYLSNRLKEMLKEKKSNFALIVLDLDDFKKINDTYGHQVGDEVLKEFTSLVKSHTRKEDIFARWGGEEFLLLLEDSSLEDAMIKAEDIRQIIDRHSFNTIGHLSSSLGLAYRQENDDSDSILRRADKALYEAKINGKNQVVLKKD